MKKIFILFFSFFFMSFSQACDVHVRMINGVWNFDQKTLSKSNEMLREKLSNVSEICVKDPLFNPSQGWITDISETYDLKRTVETGFWVNMKNNLVLALTSLLSTLYNQLNLWTDGSPIPDSKKTINSMWATIRKDLDSGKGVVLVSHSEGNLFALALKNKSLELGYDENIVQVVHIAPPTYITPEMVRQNFFLSKNDEIIMPLLNINDPNMFEINDNNTTRGHGILSTYLNSNLSVKFVDNYCIPHKTTPDKPIIEAITQASKCSIGPCVSIGFSLC